MHPLHRGRLAAAVSRLMRWLPLRGKRGGKALPQDVLQARRRFFSGKVIRVAAMLLVPCSSRAVDAKRAEQLGGSSSIEKVSHGSGDRGHAVAESLRRLNRMNDELRAGAKDDRLMARWLLFETTCHRANPEELRALAAMIPDLAIRAPKSLYPESRFEECIVAYGTAAFRHEIAKLKARPSKLEMPPSKASPPAELQVAPKRLRDAWLTWQGAIEPFERLKEAALNQPAETDEMLGARDAVTFLKKLGPTPPPGLWREIVLQEYQSRQDLALRRSESEGIRRARHRGILLSLLAEGRMAEAVGAVCSQLAREEGYPSDPSRQTYAALTREFLIAQGLDWELIYTGFLLAERPVKAGRVNPGTLANTEAWLMVGALGSSRGVQLGLDWISQANMGAEDARPFLLRALGPAPSTPPTPPTLIDPRPKRSKPLPAEVRAKAGAALSSFLDPKHPVAPLNRTLGDIPPRLAKDLQDPLKKLLAHRSPAIASRALWLLRTAGLVSPETKVATPVPPVRVRLTVDGAPLAGTPVAVQGNGIHQRLTTASDGALVISLQDVLEPQLIKTLYLSAASEQRRQSIPSLPAADPVMEGSETAAEASPQPWFATSIPVTIGDEAVQEIAIQTGELEVGLKGKPGIPATAQIGLILAREARNLQRSIRMVGRPGESVLFRGVQVGKYQLFIEGAELAGPAWQDVHVTRMGSLKLIELEPGRSVRAELAGPRAPNSRLATIAKLTCDGAEVNGRLLVRGNGNGWDRLPLGKYRLRIPSTAELEAAVPARAVLRQTVPKSQRHAAHEMEFELTVESPPVVDLGVIQLEPENAGETK